MFWQVRLLVMDQQTCNTRHRDIITNRMFCAVSDERPMVRDSCFGDSGSPFAVRVRTNILKVVSLFLNGPYCKGLFVISFDQLCCFNFEKYPLVDIISCASSLCFQIFYINYFAVIYWTFPLQNSSLFCIHLVYLYLALPDIKCSRTLKSRPLFIITFCEITYIFHCMHFVVLSVFSVIFVFNSPGFSLLTFQKYFETWL